MSEENRIEITVLHGDDHKSLTFSGDFKIRGVIKEAIVQFGLPLPVENYHLFNMRAIPNAQYLSDLDKSLKDYSIADKSTLVLAHIHVVGGNLPCPS